MQGKLADMHTTLSACRAYVYSIARACDAKNNHPAVSKNSGIISFKTFFLISFLL